MYSYTYIVPERFGPVMGRGKGWLEVFSIKKTWWVYGCGYREVWRGLFCFIHSSEMWFHTCI
jgi:hypothetical protein